MLWVLYFLRNKTPYLLDRKLNRPQKWSGHCGEEKYLLPI
jgi:hypothetical protein